MTRNPRMVKVDDCIEAAQVRLGLFKLDVFNPPKQPVPRELLHLEHALLEAEEWLEKLEQKLADEPPCGDRGTDCNAESNRQGQAAGQRQAQALAAKA